MIFAENNIFFDDKIEMNDDNLFIINWFKEIN